jgi:hypothetical protein
MYSDALPPREGVTWPSVNLAVLSEERKEENTNKSGNKTATRQEEKQAPGACQHEGYKNYTGIVIAPNRENEVKETVDTKPELKKRKKDMKAAHRFPPFTIASPYSIIDRFAL